MSWADRGQLHLTITHYFADHLDFDLMDHQGKQGLRTRTVHLNCSYIKSGNRLGELEMLAAEAVPIRAYSLHFGKVAMKIGLVTRRQCKGNVDISA